MPKNKTEGHLSRSAQRAYNFIVKYISENGFSPSRTDLKNGLGYSSEKYSGYLIDRLEKLGYIKRVRGIRRSISLVNFEDPKEVVVRENSMDFIDLAREVFPDNPTDLSLIRWDDEYLVASQLPPLVGQLTFLNSPMLKIHTLGVFTGKGVLDFDGSFLATHQSALRRVVLILQPRQPTL